jgi:hypothetical protein
VDLQVIPAQVYGPPRSPRTRNAAMRPRCRAGERRRARQAACVWRFRSRHALGAHCRNRGAETTRAGSLAPVGGIAAVGKGKMLRADRCVARAPRPSHLIRITAQPCGPRSARPRDRLSDGPRSPAPAAAEARLRGSTGHTSSESLHGYGEARDRGPRRRAGWPRARRAVTVTVTPERLPRPQRSDSAERPAGSAAGLQDAAGPSSALALVKIAGGGRGEEGWPGA